MSLSIPTHMLECQFKPKYQELGLFFDVAEVERFLSIASLWFIVAFDPLILGPQLSRFIIFNFKFRKIIFIIMY